MVGNLRPQKDHPTLLRALHRLTAGGAGRHPGGRHRQHLGRPRLPRRVRGHGRAPRRRAARCACSVSRDDAPALIAGADAGLATSKNETGPLVVLEYMAGGLPFLATDTGEIAHAVRDLGVGWVTPPRDAGALAAALRDLLALTPEHRREMGATGPGRGGPGLRPARRHPSRRGGVPGGRSGPSCRRG